MGAHMEPRGGTCEYLNLSAQDLGDPDLCNLHQTLGDAVDFQQCRCRDDLGDGGANRKTTIYDRNFHEKFVHRGDDRFDGGDYLGSHYEGFSMSKMSLFILLIETSFSNHDGGIFLESSSHSWIIS